MRCVQVCLSVVCVLYYSYKCLLKIVPDRRLVFSHRHAADRLEILVTTHSFRDRCINGFGINNKYGFFTAFGMYKYVVFDRHRSPTNQQSCFR